MLKNKPQNISAKPHKQQIAFTRPSKRSAGFSLIEVMVSLVVVSLGLLALTNLQTRSVTNATVAYAETQSMMFLQEMVEYLRIDKEAAINGTYNISMSGFSDLAERNEDDPLAIVARSNWFNNLNNTLPNAKASIHCDNTSLCIVEVQHDIAGSLQKQTLAAIL